jgi:hypothetical protein
VESVEEECAVQFKFHFRIIWMAGCLAAMSSVTYPAISAFASEHAAPDQQGENY